MTAIDFARSFMTWMPHAPDGNIARIQLDAACTLADPATGSAETYYLIAPCRSERMYLDTPLFQMPNYEFCGIWSASELLILRTHWVSVRDHREYGGYGAPPARFRGVRLDVRTLHAAEPLTTAESIIEATLANRPLIARTELRDPDGGQTATLEYPIKTMNVARHPNRFQIDTGPLIVPDFTSTAPHPIERFEVAHVVYNTFDRAEFILRRPTPIGEGNPPVRTTDYSDVRILPTRTTLLAASVGARSG
jgi:hypothetical protein